MSPRHRHFFAFPLFLLCLSTVAGGGVAVTASATIASSVSGANDVTAVGGDQLFSFDDIPAAGSLSDGGKLHRAQGRLWLDDGVLLVSSPSLVTVRAADTEFTAFRGAFTVVRGSKTVTVMALTAPVLLRHGSYRFVLPVGFQGEWAPEELPAMQDLADVAARITTLKTILPETRWGELTKLSLLRHPPFPALPDGTADMWPAFLTLPRSSETLEAITHLHAFGELRLALERSDIGASRAALEHPAVQTSLTLSPDAEMLRTLIALAEDMPSIERELIPYVRDPDLWLLLSLHPQFSLAAWETDGPVGAPISARTQRLLQFPSSDVAEAHPAAAVRRWQRQFSAHAKTTDDAPRFVSLLLASLTSYRAFAVEHNLPERLSRYEHALSEIAEPFLADLSLEDHERLEAWKSEELPEYQDPAPLPVETVPEMPQSFVPEEIIQEEPVSGSDAQAQEAEAKSLLLSVGGLFAVTTQLRADVRGLTDVEGIIFASEAGDWSFAFTIDVPGKRVTDIRRDGEMLPYPMSLESFAAWATGR